MEEFNGPLRFQKRKPLHNNHKSPVDKKTNEMLENSGATEGSHSQSKISIK
jgi:hypothetical protein